MLLENFILIKKGEELSAQNKGPALRIARA